MSTQIQSGSIYDALNGVRGPDQQRIAEVGVDWINTILQKNTDYGSSVFKVPMLAPAMEAGDAILVRMTDKIHRIAALKTRPAEVVSESLEDTIKDLGAYCLLWLARPKGEGSSKSDSHNELHGPGGEIDLREHGPGVESDDVDLLLKTVQAVRSVYPNATWYFQESRYRIDKDRESAVYNWISDPCRTEHEAWKSALFLINESKSQSGSSASNASTSISTPTPLPSNSIQPHVATHPPTTIRAGESSCGTANEPRCSDFQSH